MKRYKAVAEGICVETDSYTEAVEAVWPEGQIFEGDKLIMTIADDRVSHHNYFISLEEWRILDKWRNR